MNVEGSKLKAVGGPRLVQSIMFGSTKGKPSTRRTPRMMQQDQPVNGMSNELLYTGGDASNVEFIGRPSLWQGEKQETQIKAEKVAVDGKTGNLAAQGSVVSQMMVQDTNPTTKVRETTRSTATGAADALRRCAAQGDIHDEGACSWDRRGISRERRSS